MSSAEAIPALLIALPILAATLPLLLGLRFDRVGWPVAVAVCVVEFVLVVALAVAVYVPDGFGIAALAGEGRIVHPLAGFERPVGIELYADRFSTLVLLLIGSVAAGTLAFARRSGPRRNSFYSGYLLLTGGLFGVVLTGDLFNMFVFLEIVGLATYALIASGRSGESAIAALKYLIVGTAGASLFLIGVGYAFVATGTLNMLDLSAALAGETAAIDEPLYDDPLVIASFAFIAVGLMLKAAIFPLHTWIADAYAESPDAVSIYISGLVSTAGAYALGRVTFTVFTVDFFAATPLARELVLALATVSIVAGSVLAVIQTRVKRMFAYSSVAHFGMIVAGFMLAVDPAVASAMALYGAIIHLFGHGLMKTGLFAAAGVLAASSGARTVDEYAGLARSRPFTAGSIGVLGLALVGVPPSIGFLGKWYIGVGAVQAEAWPVVAVIFLSTVLTLAYIARLLERLYFTPADEFDLPSGNRAVTDGGRSVSLGMAGLAIAVALLSVALGFAGWELQTMLEPFATEVLNL